MRLRILNYNVHKGRAFFSRRKTWAILEELIMLVDADIVFLQEFLKEPEAEKLLEIIADHLWPHHSFGRNATAGDYHYGNAILSKFPLISSNNTNLTNHYLEKRGLLYAKVQPEPGRDLHLFCTHLDLREQGRRRQIDKILEVFKTTVPSDETLVLAGDFNDWKERLDPIVREKLNVSEVFRDLNGRLIPTSPSVYPVFALDRIYYRGLIPHTAVTLNERALRYGSDHLPMVVEVDF